MTASARMRRAFSSKFPCACVLPPPEAASWDSSPPAPLSIDACAFFPPSSGEGGKRAKSGRVKRRRGHMRMRFRTFASGAKRRPRRLRFAPAPKAGAPRDWLAAGAGCALLPTPSPLPRHVTAAALLFSLAPSLHLSPARWTLEAKMAAELVEAKVSE